MARPREKDFETAMLELERVVEQLEKGDLTLDEALKQFEDGVNLVRLLNRRLEQAETRVSKLLEEAGGEFRLESLGGYSPPSKE